MLEIIGTIIKGVLENFNGRQKIKKAAQENTARLLANKEDNNASWEMANLQDKDKWLRRVSFVMFTFPFIWAIFDKNGVHLYFSVVLSTLPTWYVKAYLSITGGIWGLSSLKNTAITIVNEMKRKN